MTILVRTRPTTERKLLRHTLVPVLLASVSAIVCQPARAQTQITGAQTTTEYTATANNGQPNDITITDTGSITPASANNSSQPVTAVVVNSSNNFENDGTITINDSSPAYGVLVTQSSNTSGNYTITNTGTISVSDSTPNTNIPLTAGSSRYGILIEPGVAFNGGIINSGTVSVLGNNSAAIAVAGSLTGQTSPDGNINISGTVGATGNYSYGVLTGSLGLDGSGNMSTGQYVAGTGAISGSVNVTGTVTAYGQGASAIMLGGAVAGQVYIDGALTTTGFYDNGSVAARPVPYPTTPLPAANLVQSGPTVQVGGNVMGGVIVDTAAVITSAGSSPALEISPLLSGTSGATNIITISPSSTYPTYGLVNNGIIAANSVYDGFSTTAVQVGSNALTYTAVGIGGTGGILNTGTISSTSYAANATALSFQNGATSTKLYNSGTIQATASFGANSNVATAGTATAISDTVGALSSITNTGTISATSASGAATTAMDLSGNTTSVIVQQLASGTTTVPSITGDILFGSGNATLDLETGALSGAVSFGTGTNTFIVNGNAQVLGAITETPGGQLALDVASGRLIDTSTSNLGVSNLTIGATGEIDFAILPKTSTTPGANGQTTVVAQAIFNSGAKIGLDFLAKLTIPETITVVDASNSSGGLVNQNLLTLGEVPYFYVAKFLSNPASNTVQIKLSDQTFAAAGVPGNAAAYAAIFNTYDRDPAVFNTLNVAPNVAAFRSEYRQLLPAYSGGLFELLSEGSDAVVHAQANNPLALRGDRSGAWAQQLGFGASQNSNAAPGYYGGGLGFAFGWEEPASAISTIGVSVAYLRGSITQEQSGPNDQQIGTIYDAGVYWREIDGGFHATASLNGGVAQLNDRRNFAGIDSSSNTFNNQALSSWTGGMGQAHLGVNYEQPLGDDFFVRPELSGDYFALFEGGHSERNGGPSMDLTYGSSVGKQGAATGALTFGARFDDNGFIWQPEVTVGWKQVFGGPDNVVAQFVSGGPSFTLNPPSQKGGPIAKIGIHGGDKYTDIAFEVGAEDRGPYRAFSGALVARFRF